MRARSSFAVLALAALLAFSAAGGLAAEEAAADLDGKAAVLLADAPDGDAARFAQALALAFEREAEAAGISIAAKAAVAGTDEAPIDAMRAAREAGARWVLIARCRIEDARVLWRAAVYDGLEGSLVGADEFSAYAGLSALPLIDQSAASAMKAALVASEAPRREAGIQRRLAFSSPDEGAAVFLGAAEGGILLGRIEDGALEAPYLPFRAGQSLAIGLEKEGYWPTEARIKVVDADEPIKLPLLMRRTDRALVVSYGTGRMLGAAAAYRWYPLPDAVYLRAEDSLWAAYDFLPGSLPVLHDELRLGAGAYLVSPPSSRFRISAGLGLSGIFTMLTAADLDRRAGLDLCIEPIFYTMEWHWQTWALVLEQRFPYSLGLRSGFIPRQWLSLGGYGPLFCSLGVMLKW